MAKLTTEARKKLDTKKFAIPAQRKYPIPDIAHARNAIVRVRQYGTPAERKKVYAAVAKAYPGLAKRSSVVSVKKAAKKVK